MSKKEASKKIRKQFAKLEEEAIKNYVSAIAPIGILNGLWDLHKKVEAFHDDLGDLIERSVKQFRKQKKISKKEAARYKLG